jgi:uncharacterized Zn-finger protein
MEASSTSTVTKWPHELWREANGDRTRYLELMREHGHLVKRDTPVVPHKFVERRGCILFCNGCSLPFDHPVHHK